MKTWKPEIKAHGENFFCNNSLVFATKEEALESAQDLMNRWIMVSECRAVESKLPANYKRENGKDTPI